MSTTQLFVELLVIGLGGIFWLSLLIASIFGFPREALSFVSHLSFVLPIIGFAYVLGIIIDRIAYRIFRRKEEKNEKKILGDNPLPPTNEKINYILVHSAELRYQILYNRSRLRICRSWTINFGMIAVSFALFYLRMHLFLLEQFLLLLLILVTLFCGTYFIWDELSKDYFKNIRLSFDFLTKERKGPQNTQKDTEENK